MPTIRLDAEQYTRAVAKLTEHMVTLHVMGFDSYDREERLVNGLSVSGGARVVLNPDVTRTEDAKGTLITLRPNALLVSLLEAVEK